MREDSFTKFCISACIFMILVSLSINFVLLITVFPTGLTGVEKTTDDVLNSTGGSLVDVVLGNFLSLLTVESLAAIGVGAIVLISAMATGSYNVFAAYLFGAIFWLSWGNVLVLFSYGDYMAVPAMTAIYVMMTVVMAFIFLGAVIGILGGND